MLSEARRANWGEEWYSTAKGDIQALVVDRDHYINNGDGREELYALDRDLLEQHDLAPSEEWRPLHERLERNSKQSLRKTKQRIRCSKLYATSCTFARVIFRRKR